MAPALCVWPTCPQPRASGAGPAGCASAQTWGQSACGAGLGVLPGAGCGGDREVQRLGLGRRACVWEHPRAQTSSELSCLPWAVPDARVMVVNAIF